MKRQHIFSILAAGTAIVLAACTSDLTDRNTFGTGDGKIRFDVSVATPVTRAVTMGSMKPQRLNGCKDELWLIPSVTNMESFTRGTQLSETNVLTSFGVSAYKHSNTVDITNAYPNYFYNKKVTKDAVTHKYGFTQDYYWPTTDEYLTFYAYYPYNSMSITPAEDDNTLVSLSAATQKGPQTVVFTVSDDVTQQVDFMTAVAANQTPAKTTTGPAATEPSVSLSFQHQLCGIRFKIGNQFPTKGYIQQIRLTNVYKSGTFTIGASASNAWVRSNQGNISVSYTADQAVTGKGQDVTSDDDVFLMIPYTFPENSGAKIEIDFQAGDKVTTVSASLDNHVWEAGKTVTYELSSQNLTTLQIKSIDYFQYTRSTLNDSVPVKAWGANDKVGLYVVQGKDANGDPDGRTIRYANIPVTYNNTTGKWEIDHTTSQGTVFKYPGDSYYLYYPYSNASNGQPVGYPNDCQVVGASAETFFESVINKRAENKANFSNQEELSDFKLADLQVAKAVTPEEDTNLPASTIKASMSRQVGLARLKLGVSQVVTHKIFTNGVLSENQTNMNAKTPFTATNQFQTNKPNAKSNVYYFYTPHNTGVTINSIQNNDDTWTEGKEFTILKGTASEVWTATTIRSLWSYVTATWEYTTPAAHTFTIPCNGNYTMECWGASGGTGLLIATWQNQMNSCNISNIYGRGAYTKGNIDLTTSTNGGYLYVYVGGKGESVVTYTAAQQQPGVAYDKNGDGGYWKHETAGGFNGGGIGAYSPQDDHSGAGGGATDIRLNNDATDWDSRIMVAGGGGGGNGINSPTITSTLAGMHGGTPNITNAAMATWTTNWTANVNQTAGYQKGVGQPSIHGTNHSPGGGGGGYMGGIYWASTDTHYGPASGGSSFISGATGCATVTGYTFSSTSFISGTSSSCPSMTIGGTPAALGKVDGYARITLNSRN